MMNQKTYRIGQWPRVSEFLSRFSRKESLLPTMDSPGPAISSRNWLPLALSLLLVIATGKTRGDERWYAWTYGATVLDAGETELEYAATITATKELPGSDVWETAHQLEIERGLTSRLDVGLYQILHRHPDRRFFYEGYKLRVRYLLPVKPFFFQEPVLYVELANLNHLDTQFLEGKLILERNLGNLNLAWNLSVEKAFPAESGESIELQFNQGISWPLGKAVRLGGELVAGDEKLAAGPVVAFTGHEFSFLLGMAWPIKGEPPARRFRLMLTAEL